VSELVIDSFAGGGGASLGIEQALGRPVDIAINHDALAVAMHMANHPGTRHYQQDIWSVKPLEATKGRPVGLAWFSPDCFPAGTLVLTDSGYRAIETIEVGTNVLTHKGRWRPVTETNRAEKPLIEIRGHGHPGLRLSAEHPIYARRNARQYAEWMPAAALDRGWYWASPTKVPAMPVPVVGGRGLASAAMACTSPPMCGSAGAVR
jgi:hypothetical protein